ncbi:MAG: hypothetical protein QOJ99_832 [Bryobacterales bacterium]|nr:hypothetical protein [Bryobacterales bacterium]
MRIGTLHYNRVAKNNFEFDLYRLVVQDDQSLLDFMGRPIQSDEDIVKILRNASSGRFDRNVRGPKNRVYWSLREAEEDRIESHRTLTVRLIRSVSEQSGITVTEHGISDAVSEVSPPMGLPIYMIFYMDRHLVAVEHASSLMTSDFWRTAVHDILDASSQSLELRSSLRLEPVPEPAEILDAFRSFDRLIRLRVHLIIPNPELTRITRQLYDRMRNGGIRDYLQDMRNSGGLSKEEGQLPFSSAAMAQQGYKKGEVILDGILGGRRVTLRTGRKAARGRIEQVRDFVRGSLAAAHTKEAQGILGAVLSEIDRIADPPTES